MRWSSPFLAAALVLACGEPDADRAPPCHTCGFAGGANEGGVSDADAPDAAPCEPYGPAGVVITGKVTTLENLEWPDRGAPYEGRAEVDFTGAPCGRVIAPFDGSAADAGDPKFRAEAVFKTGAHWFGVRADPADTSVLASLILADTASDRDYPVGVTLLPLDDLEAVYSAAGVTRDPARATVMLVMVSRSALGVSPAAGVEVNFPSGTLAYEGGGWGPSGGTGSRGLVFALNVDAAPFPGENQSFAHREADGTSGSEFAFRKAAGYVTIVRAALGE